MNSFVIWSFYTIMLKPLCFSHPFHHDEVFRYLVVLYNDIKTIMFQSSFPSRWTLSLSGRSTQWCQYHCSIDVFQSSFSSCWTLSLCSRSTQWCQNHHLIDMFQSSFLSRRTLVLWSFYTMMSKPAPHWCVSVVLFITMNSFVIRSFYMMMSKPSPHWYVSVILSIMMNSFVIWSFAVRTKTIISVDYYILTLAISDLSSAVFAYPLTLASTWSHRWIFGETGSVVLAGSGGAVNSLDFYPASLRSLGCFFTSGAYFLHNRRQWQ